MGKSITLIYKIPFLVIYVEAIAAGAVSQGEVVVAHLIRKVIKRMEQKQNTVTAVITCTPTSIIALRIAIYSRCGCCLKCGW